MSLPRSGPSRQTLRVDYDGDDNPIYIGRAYPTPSGTVSTADDVWQIQHLTWSGGNMTVREWADGDDLYDNIWDNRAVLTYS